MTEQREEICVVPFYRSFFEAGEEMTDKGRLRLYDAILRYGFLGQEPKLTGMERGLFINIKPNIDAAIKNRANGKKGGRPKNEKGGFEKSEQSLKTDKDKDKDEDEDEDKRESKREKRAAFSPPSLEEVTEYCFERKNGINPQAFIDFYESKGWMIGKEKMKDWKAAIRTWEARDKDAPKPQAGTANIPKNRFVNFPQRDWDFEGIAQKEIERHGG